MFVVPSVSSDSSYQIMDYMQQVTHNTNGPGIFGLKLVNYHIHENQVSHETQGLGENCLVIRRGKPFKVTLMFKGRGWSPNHERLVLEVRLGNLSQRIPVFFFQGQFVPQGWSALIHPGSMCGESVSIHICSPALSSVALYQLLVHIETTRHRATYRVGNFVLLCNPWLKDDPVYMSLDAHKQEYIKSDYGRIYMGTPTSVHERPWLFGQYEPGVLEACLTLLQVSSEHLDHSDKDYVLRADPVYLSRVVCAMVNSNDDLGLLLGRWQDDYRDGIKPTDWNGSAEILQRWLSSNCQPVRYGQCWVFASVLCTVLRVLGIPSRVVTVFSAAHDTDGNTTIEEFYSTTGEKLNLSNDSIWNFHVWVECWMRRLDLGEEFDGWQVVDPTPQERSGRRFRCGPCPVAAIQHCIDVPFDTRFLYASVDGDVHRLILSNGKVVRRLVDTECVGQLVYTKSIGSDSPENLTQTYKGVKRTQQPRALQNKQVRTGSGHRVKPSDLCVTTFSCTDGLERFSLCSSAENSSGVTPSRFKVSVTTEGSPLLGEDISVCVTVTNHSNIVRDLTEHVNAQLKEYNSNPRRSFWRKQSDVRVQPNQELKIHHTIPQAEYESILKLHGLVNVAVVVQDMVTGERDLDAQEFSMKAPQIRTEIHESDRIQMKKEKTAQVTFTNPFSRSLSEVVLSVEGSGLLKGKQEARLALLKPGEKIEKKVSIVASSPGTKVLTATLSHSSSSVIVSRSYHKVFVMSA